MSDTFKAETFSGCLMHNDFLASLSLSTPHTQMLFLVSMTAEKFQQDTLAAYTPSRVSIF